MGQSSRHGHYTAIGVDSKNNFHIFDDAKVTEISEENVIKGNYYILFYERRRSDGSGIRSSSQPATEVMEKDNFNTQVRSFTF